MAREHGPLIIAERGVSENGGMRPWWVLAGVGLLACIVGTVLHADGVGGFATHPASLVALAAASVGVARFADEGPGRTRWWLIALAVALNGYLLLGVWASADQNTFAINAWAVAWVPVTDLLSVVGIAGAGLRRTAIALATLVGLLTVASGLVADPVAPFDGLLTASGASSRLPGATEVLSMILMGALSSATIAMAVILVRARPLERRYLLTCTTVTAAGPGLFVFCIALAVLANPGEVDPSTGSVAYLVVTAVTAALVTFAVTSFSKWAVRALLGGWILAIVIMLGVAASPIVSAQPLIGVLVIAAITLAGAVAGVVAVHLLERWAALPRLELIGGSVPGLSPRENEVPAMVADGSTNARIAAQLYLSERTVEQHLRSVFSKLHLGSADGSNRRIRAAVIWWRHNEEQPAATPEETGT